MKATSASIAGAALMGVLLPLFFVSSQGTHVVINEIKVGGEKATDEFVELYNPTDADVNLAGWRLSKKTASGSLSNLLTEFPSVVIAAHGFLLIAHNDYAGSAPKDLAYSTQSSITADNTVILYSDNGQTIVDLVGMGSAGEAEGATAPSPDPGMSIERANGADTNKNTNDFAVRAAPTPKQGVVNNDQGSGNNSQGTMNGNQGSDAAPAAAIAINEVLPNPAGNDEEGEWIELINLGDQEVNLTDWAIEDASGKHYTIKQDGAISSTTIAPKGYFLLPRAATGIALNNTGTEILTLLTSSEHAAISLNYIGPAEEGQAWARNADGNFAWTTAPTPSASNVITAPVQENKESQSSNSPSTGAINRAPTTITPTHSFTLVINELLPNPQGDDTTGEWIELKNEGNDEATLAGLTISDESGATYAFTTQQNQLPPRGLLLISRSQSKITLNNDGDMIVLKFQGKEIARAAYGKSEEGMSFARDDAGNYAWTTAPTPGAINTFSLPAEIEEAQKDEESSEQESMNIDQETTKLDAPSPLKQPAASAPSVKGVRTVMIDAIRELSRNTNVSIEGIVIVPPGVFGKTTLYLDGIQVYSVAIKFPELALGDRVQISGYVSATGNETRITVPKTGWVKRLGASEAPEPLEATAETLGEEHEGKLVRVEGELMEKKGTTLWLDDNTGEVRIVLKEGTGLSSENFSIGQQYAVAGVLSETSSGYRILPRGNEDIEMRGEILGASADANAARQYRGRPLYYILTSLAALAIAGGLGWRKWKERQNTTIPPTHDPTI